MPATPAATNRSTRCRLAGALLLLATLAPALSSPPAGAQDLRGRAVYSPQAAVKNALNLDRTNAGVRALRTQAEAQAKAQAWANRLASEGRIYHSTLTDGIRARWCSLGENVGYGPSVGAIDVAYMNSPHHRANILNPKWNGVGVGYATRGKQVYTVHVFIKTC